MPAIQIIGDGCAGLSLAARARELPDHQLTLIVPEGAPRQQEHIWGFWHLPILNTAAGLSHCSWKNWQVVTNEKTVVLTSINYPYHAIYRSRWTSMCKELAIAHGVKIVSQSKVASDQKAQILDTRPQPVPHGQLMQHFIGWEVLAKSGSFNPSVATMMDFRCDQSRGIHFIYILPFSDSEALVESTMFSCDREPDEFFEKAILDYLKRCHSKQVVSVKRTEKGAIPMGLLERSDVSVVGLGGNGGAIKPSSGYAFYFIQKQISAAILTAQTKNKLMKITSPHKIIDLWMDQIFVKVLKEWPAVTPHIFIQLADALSGDEFALFMSGEACWRLRLKVIFSMPKWIFIRSFIRLFYSNFLKFKIGT